MERQRPEGPRFRALEVTELAALLKNLREVLPGESQLVADVENLIAEVTFYRREMDRVREWLRGLHGKVKRALGISPDEIP